MCVLLLHFSVHVYMSFPSVTGNKELYQHPLNKVAIDMTSL